VHKREFGKGSHANFKANYANLSWVVAAWPRSYLAYLQQNGAEC